MPSSELAVGGRLLRFPAVWLRDNCPCAQCLDPGTGQKLHDITDIPEDLMLAAAGEQDAAESVTVTFAPGGHMSVFTRSWLAAHALDGAGTDPRTEDSKELWLPADIGPGHRPEGSWPRYLDEPAEQIRCLDAVLRQGFVLLHDVPAEPGMVLDVAASFGYVRETNYGRLFDVRVEPSPDNLAYTSREILPHTDNPYRDPVPTIQLLHCLRTADDGGDTGLVDGFCAAAALRAAEPAAFDLLTSNDVSFGYQDKGAELRASRAAHRAHPGRPGPRRPVQQQVGAAATAAACRDHPLLRGLPAVGGTARRAAAAAEPAPGARRLPGLRQHEDPARPHCLQHERELGRTAPAGLLRRPGRAGEHAGHAATQTVKEQHDRT